jgi:hypothetical protein
MEARKQRVRRVEGGAGTRCTLQNYAPVTDFLQVDLTSMLLPPPNDVIKLWVHQWMNPLITRDLMTQSHPQRPPLYIASKVKALTHEMWGWGSISYVNHSIYFSVLFPLVITAISY